MNEIGRVAETIASVTMKASIVGGGATGAGSYFDKIDANAAVLGVLISGTGVLITGIYYLFMTIRLKASDKSSDRLDNLEEESKRTNKTLSLILSEIKTGK